MMTKTPSFPLMQIQCVLLGAFLISYLLGSPSAAAQDPVRPQGMKSIRELSVLPTNTAKKNREALQAAIDWASARGEQVDF
jgi:hypothetical protein